MADPFPGIPRVKAQIVDGNLRIAPLPGTPKVTLIGCTDNSLVSLNDPLLVRPSTNLNMFDNADGTVSEISKGIVEARDGGAQNIEVVVTSLTNVTTSPLTAAQRRTALVSTYAALINHPLDVVVPLGIAIDTPSQTAATNFGYDLAEFCYNASIQFNSCIGVIPTEPPVPFTSTSASLTQVEAWVAGVEAFNTTAIAGASFTSFDGVTDSGADGVPDNFAFWATDNDTLPTGSPPAANSHVIKDLNNNPVDIGKYISVVAGIYTFTNDVSDKVSPTTSVYNNYGAAVYAGFITSLAPHRAPTNKVIPGVGVLRNLSISQANRLAVKRFVCFQAKAKGLTVVNAMTGAYNISIYYRSDFVRLTSIRITNAAVERIRAVADPFIGEPIDGVSLNALNKEIDQALLKFQTLGALQRYSFTIVSTPSMQVLGEITIPLTLVPAFETTEIDVNVSLAQE